MSTRSDIGYKKDGEVRLTYCHYDGFPEVILPPLIQALADHGFEWYVKEIERVSEKGGMRVLDYNGQRLSTDLFDDMDKTIYPDSDNDYGYIVHEDYTIEIKKFSKDYAVMTNRDILKSIFGQDIFGEK